MADWLLMNRTHAIVSPQVLARWQCSSMSRKKLFSRKSARNCAICLVNKQRDIQRNGQENRSLFASDVIMLEI